MTKIRCYNIMVVDRCNQQIPYDKEEIVEVATDGKKCVLPTGEISDELYEDVREYLDWQTGKRVAGFRYKVLG